MILRAAAVLGLALVGAAAPTSPSLWPGGRVSVRHVDGVLEQNASAVFDELERKTLVRFVRQRGGGLTIRAAGAAGAPKATELCCFNATGGAPMLRQLSLAVMGALGADPEAPSPPLRARFLAEGAGLAGGPLVRPEEADAINELYAAKVLPPMSALPARVEVGIWQLVPAYSPEDWADMVEGRGRRVVEGSMRWSRGVAVAGQMEGLVGAVPTFVFRGNKAEIVLLGEESAELAPGPSLPSEAPDEGLGAGVRRVTRHARELTGRGFAGGLPTYLGDASALLLRASCAEMRPSTGVGDADAAAEDRRSAVAWAEASRWAQAQPGALLGIPSFAPSAPGQALEVLVLHRPGTGVGTGVGAEPRRPGPEREAEAERDAEAPGGGGPSLGLMLAGLWGAAGVAGACCFQSMRSRRGGVHLSRAERDLERLVSSL